jgi:thermopsin
MSPRTAVLSIGIVFALVVSVLVAVPFGGNIPVHPRASTGGDTALLPSSGQKSRGTPSASVAEREQGILSYLKEKGVPRADIHLPDFSAGANHVGDRDQLVTPTYAAAPAPMGVADIGVQNESGTLVGTVLNSTSVAGTIHINNLQSLYVDGDGPDTYGIQMNSVLNGVTIFGNDSDEFWTQNYVSYTPSNESLEFGDNVWNFSNPTAYLSPNAFYAFSPNGTLVAPVYYYAVGPTISIPYPFTVTFYENASVLEDRPAVYFNYTVSNSTSSISGNFDWVIFNSTVGTPTQPAAEPYYQVNGQQYDPVGLINDIELDVVGTGDGDTTTFLQANAQLSLTYWNSTKSAMEPVPSAYNSGQDTGETSDGLAVYWATVDGSPVAEMAPGPSFLNGLWNYSDSGPGALRLKGDLSPANAFLFVNQGGAENDSAAQWVPSSPNGTTVYYILPGTYHYQVLMSDYSPLQATESLTTSRTLGFTLTQNLSEGIYTPLFAFGNSDLANISAAGAGTPADPYIVLNNEYAPLDPVFAIWNDYDFPVFSGLLIVGTNASVEVTPAPFSIVYPSWMYGGSTGILAQGYPTSNKLQLQFYQVSNVTLLNAASITGWLSAFMTFFPLGEAMFWAATDSLVASNTFQDQGSALMFYGGSNNTVWGNTFDLSTPIDPNPNSTLNATVEEGIYEAESGDLIYNNYFDVPVPAVTPSSDPVSCEVVCYPAIYNDTWNVTDQPASDYQVLDGANLTGSIIQSSYQGGNFWWNYGTQSDPFGVLPYNDSGTIITGGDYVPLIDFSLYTVNFTESGLPSGAFWNITVDGVTYPALTPPCTGSCSAFRTLFLPNGTYQFSIEVPAGFTGPTSGNFTVSGTTTTVSLVYLAVGSIVFSEIGLATYVPWSTTIVGPGTGGMTEWQNTTADSATFFVPVGSYQFTVSAPGYTASPSAGSVMSTLDGGNNITVRFTAVPGTLSAEVRPITAQVWVDGSSASVLDGAVLLSVSPGVHSIEVAAPGYVTYYNNVSVTSSHTTSLNVQLVVIPGVTVITKPGTTTVSPLAIATIVVLAILALALLILLVWSRRRGGSRKASAGSPEQPSRTPPSGGPPGTE